MRLADNPVYQLEVSRRQRHRAAIAAPLMALVVNGACLGVAMYRAAEDLAAVVLVGCTLAAAACPLAAAAGTAQSVASEFAGRRLSALALTSAPAYDILRGKFHAAAGPVFGVLAAVFGANLFALLLALVTGASVGFELPAAAVSMAFAGLAGCYACGAVAMLAATATRSPAAGVPLSGVAAALGALLWVWPLPAGLGASGLLASACGAAALFLVCTPVFRSAATMLFGRALSQP